MTFQNICLALLASRCAADSMALTADLCWPMGLQLTSRQLEGASKHQCICIRVVASQHARH